MGDGFDFELRDVGSTRDAAYHFQRCELLDDVPIIKAPDKKLKLPKEPFYIITDAQVFPCHPRWAK